MKRCIRSVVLTFAVMLIATGLALAAGERKKDSGGGGVTFAAQPAERSLLDANGVSPAQWGFTVSLDTHSVDLMGIDLASRASLRAGNGTELKPVAWRGLNEGGHHRSGLLLFSADEARKQGIEPGKGAAMELVLRDVAGIKQRVLRWGG